MAEGTTKPIRQKFKEMAKPTAAVGPPAIAPPSVDPSPATTGAPVQGPAPVPKFNFSLHLKNKPQSFLNYVIMMSNVYNELPPNQAEKFMNHQMQTLHALEVRQSILKFNMYQPDDEMKLNPNEIMEKMLSRKRKRTEGLILDDEEKKDKDDAKSKKEKEKKKKDDDEENDDE